MSLNSRWIYLLYVNIPCLCPPHLIPLLEQCGSNALVITPTTPPYTASRAVWQHPRVFFPLRSNVDGTTLCDSRLACGNVSCPVGDSIPDFHGIRIRKLFHYTMAAAFSHISVYSHSSVMFCLQMLELSVMESFLRDGCVRGGLSPPPSLAEDLSRHTGQRTVSEGGLE